MFFQSLFNSLPGVLSQGLIFGIMAIGVFITFRILDFADLTVDGSFATGGAVFGILSLNGVGVVPALLIALVAGALAGAITALLNCYLGIPGILAGILTQLMLYSINLAIMGKPNIAVPSRGAVLSSLYIETALPLLLLISAIVIAALYWFFGTKYGASIRAVGSNEDMSRANGINVQTRKIVALMISNALVAFAGALFAQYNGSADINMGRGAIVIGLAAIIIGGAIVKKWGKNFAIQLAFVLVGGFIYYLVYQIVILTKIINADWLKMISAVVVVIFLATPYIKSHYIADWKAKRDRIKEGK